MSQSPQLFQNWHTFTVCINKRRGKAELQPTYFITEMDQRCPQPSRSHPSQGSDPSMKDPRVEEAYDQNLRHDVITPQHSDSAETSEKSQGKKADALKAENLTRALPHPTE